MTILSAQTIRKHSTIDLYGKYGPDYNFPNYNNKPLIYPFVERGTIRGRSFGLSACTYDCRIDRPLIIPVHQSRLAVTMERFCFPNNICGSVLDKSSWARLFVSAFNTHLDPGWEGYLTVELANLSEECIEFEAGDPLCQIKFEFLDEPTKLPYRGKYQNQEQNPTPMILEK